VGGKERKKRTQSVACGRGASKLVRGREKKRVGLTWPRGTMGGKEEEKEFYHIFETGNRAEK